MNPLNVRARFSAIATKLSATGLIVSDSPTPTTLPSFIDSVLRGIGQVMLQNNSYAGLIFLVGIFYNSAVLGWAALLGAVASTATAMLLGAERSRISAGLFGFNGVLVGIALLYFLEPELLTWGYVVLAAASSTIIMAALLGSLLGMLVAWGLGAAEPAIRSGAFGFNCVLTAIVFAGFMVINVASVAYATLAVIATAVVFAALSAALEPLGMSALTSPFVLVAWLFLLASPLLRRLQTLPTL